MKMKKPEEKTMTSQSVTMKSQKLTIVSHLSEEKACKSDADTKAHINKLNSNCLKSSFAKTDSTVICNEASTQDNYDS